MGEFETLQYKRGLIAERGRDLAPDQAERLLYYRGRTKAEIEAYLDTLVEEAAERREAEAAEFRGTRTESESSEGGSPSISPGDPTERILD